jgi:hypothetical protein
LRNDVSRQGSADPGCALQARRQGIVDGLPNATEA